MRLVLSIGGSVLVPELSQQQLEAYADVITALAETHEICVVTADVQTGEFEGTRMSPDQRNDPPP